MTRLLFAFVCMAASQAFAQQSSKTSYPGNYPELSIRVLQEPELESTSAETLMFMRNEIYARHGYIFRNADLLQHFKSTAWYKPQFANVEAKLTEVERKNIALILTLEKRAAAAVNETLMARTIRSLPFLRLPIRKDQLTPFISLRGHDAGPDGTESPYEAEGRAFYGLLPDTSQIYAVVWLAFGPPSIATNFVITITTLDKKFQVIDSAPVDLFTRFDEFGSDGSCQVSNERHVMTLNANWSYDAENSGDVTCYDLGDDDKKKAINAFHYDRVVSGLVHPDGSISQDRKDER